MIYSGPSQWAINGSRNAYNEKLIMAAIVCWIFVNSQKTLIILSLFPSATKLPILAPMLPVMEKNKEISLEMTII